MIIFNDTARITIDPQKELAERLTKESLQDILKNCSDKLINVRDKLHKLARTCTSIPELAHIAPCLDRARIDLWPRGTVEDWRYNRSPFCNEDDKVISCERLWHCIGLMRKEPEDIIFEKLTLKETADHLETTAQNTENTIALAKAAFAVYKDTTEPQPITHFDIDPDKELKAQVIPGFVWRRFLARGKLPEYLADADLTPLHRYRLEEDNGRLRFTVAQYYDYKARKYKENS